MILYNSTALEDWIVNRYAKLHIHVPKDIDIKQLAYHHSIFIHYKPMPSRYDVYGRYRGIVLDERSSIEEQREQFFHELCHILRHVGHQTMMPDAFRELQEWDANRFTMYAVLPYFMVKEYDFYDDQLIYNLATDFKVTKKLVIKRLDHIKRNSFNKFLAAEKKHVYTGFE